MRKPEMSGKNLKRDKKDNSPPHICGLPNGLPVSPCCLALGFYGGIIYQTAMDKMRAHSESKEGLRGCFPSCVNITFKLST